MSAFRFACRAASSMGAVVAVNSKRVSCESREEPRFSPLHHLLPSLQQRGQAAFPGKVVQRRDKPSETHVVRIALTGGPCAGKSSALEHIIETAKKEGYDVYTAPETATLIFNSGFSVPSTPEGQYFFQQSLARMQLQMERSMTRVAACSGRPSILVFDRGLLDAKGYMDEVSWERLLGDIGAGGDGRQNGVDEDYVLHRYDAVVHMVTAADGAEKFYKWGKTTDDSGQVVIRGEPPEQARSLDKKMQDVWKRHDKHIIIQNTAGGFKAKLQAASDAIVEVANSKNNK